MVAVGLGLVAALCWSLHDLIARSFAETLGPFRMSLWVLLFGAVFLLPVVLWNGTLATAQSSALFTAVALGAVYAFAISALLKAFSLAPVSIVGPLTGGYPALVVVWGILHGLQPTLLQWAAMAAILAGMVIVSRFGPGDGGFAAVAKGKAALVVASAAVASLSFAAAVILGQEAALGLGETETTFVSRFPAAVLVFAAVRTMEVKNAPRLPFRIWQAVAVMGLCDAIAVTSINASTHFANKEMGAMAISAYSALAVVLAWLVLKEKVSTFQWLGIVMISGGVMSLGVA